MRTWQYYGLWQLEQGHRARAQTHLDKVAAAAASASTSDGKVV
jgi:hypothetical protein